MSNEKILFLSNVPLTDEGNVGKICQSLFMDFEEEQIAQLFYYDIQPSQKKFFNHFSIFEIDVFNYIFSFGLSKMPGFYDNRQKTSNLKDLGTIVFKSNYKKTLLRNFLFSRINLLNINSFKQWIASFKPTSIFCIGTEHLFLYQILHYLSKYFNIPYFIYFADEYHLHNTGTGFIAQFMQKRFVKKTKKIVEGAEELFVISQKMKEEYEVFFGKKCTVLNHAVDKTDPPASKTSFGKNIVFLYAGSLHSDRSSALKYLAECLENLNERYHLNCVLEVYSLNIIEGKIKTDLSSKVIQISDPVFGEELKSKRASSDFLVHAESFEPEYITTTILGISTRIPEYLLSNRCTIAVGPPQVTHISIFKENNMGIVISDKKSLNKNADIIYEVIKDVNLYNNYCKNAEAYYDKEFDATKMKEYLKNTLLKR